MAELTDVILSLPADATPTATDYAIIHDTETGLAKKVLLSNLAVGAIQQTLADAKGDLFAASAADTVGKLAAGTDGHMLYVDSTQSLGIKWAAAPSGTGIPPTVMDAKGDIIAASAADTAVKLTVGADGKMLTAASGESAGLKYEDPSGGLSTVASSATPTPVAINGTFTVTALAEAAAFAAPSGTPVDGHRLVIRIKDNGTARALSWNAIYRAIGITLPTTTVISKTTYVGFIYNSADTKWDAVATVTQV